MPDRENIISIYENCILNDKQCCANCYTGGPGLGIACRTKILSDVLSMLKEQGVVEPIIMEHTVFGTSRKCSKCNQYLFPAGRYCPHCGRTVRWEDD